MGTPSNTVAQNAQAREFDPRLMDNLRQLARPAGDIVATMRRDAEYLLKRQEEGKSAYLDRSTLPLYYERDLIGIPFRFVTDPMPGRVNGNFGPQDVVRVGVVILDLTGEYPRASDPLMAQFSHRYLINDLRNLTRLDLDAHVWTLGRNPELPLTPRGQHPVTLKVYEYGVDLPEVVDGELPSQGEFNYTPSTYTPSNGQLPSAEQMQQARARFGFADQPAPPVTPTNPTGHAPRLPWGDAQPAQPAQDTSGAKRGRGRPRIHFADD